MTNLAKNIAAMACIVTSVYLSLTIMSMPTMGGVLHGPSMFLVGGVTLGIALIIIDLEDIKRFMSFALTFSSNKQLREIKTTENNFEQLVDVYLKDGGEELRKYISNQKMPRVWNIVATKLAINVPISDIKDILDFQIHKVQARLDQDLTTLRQLAAIAPAIGMFGSVLGLIRLLADLKDFDTLGINMSLALITTLYGIFIGTILLAPLIRIVEKRKSYYLKNHTNILYWLDHVEQKKPSFYMKSKLGNLDVNAI